MSSSEGRYFQGIDHLRALAAFLCVFWHFAHRPDGQLAPLASVPAAPFLDEGHSGVALFMVLSGYLFAKLLDGRQIAFGQFLVNRLLRLFPLLLLVFVLHGLLERRDDPLVYAGELVRGFAYGWPVGAWSIAVELQFYLLMPLILAGQRRLSLFPLLLVAAFVVLRWQLFQAGADVRELAYHSLIGRADQFLLGVFVARFAPSGRTAAVLGGLFYLYYAAFTAAGGFYGLEGSWVWVVHPLAEAVGFAMLVSWYDRHPLRGPVMDFVAKGGRYSYGIYLLQAFSVGIAGLTVDRWIGLDSIWEALPFGLLYFVALGTLASVTYRWVEAPFLKLRRPYAVRRREAEPDGELARVPGVA